ncbi:unnamed protein product, partial [Notodromas monacha]
MAYFGIQNAILGQSCGLIDSKGHAQNLRLIAAIDAHALSDKILEKLTATNSSTGDAKNEASQRGSCPTFVIDLFIDACQIFNNSSAPSATPILGRLICVDGHLIPSRKSKPFVIAVYHGEGKPNLDAFLFDLTNELNSLHPKAPALDRVMTVVVRALICDAVGRFWIKQTTSNAGYFCCERCILKGEYKLDAKHSIVPGSLRFLSTGQESERRPDEWHQYRLSPDGVDRHQKTGKAIKRFHRRGTTPLDNILDFSPISNMPLEEMHLCDGGAIPTTLRLLFDVKPKKEFSKKKAFGSRSGKHVVQQIVRRLLAMKMYRQPTRLNGWELDDDNLSYQVELQRVHENGNNTDLPPFFVKRYDSKKQVVECEIFTLSLKASHYPGGHIAMDRCKGKSGVTIIPFMRVLEALLVPVRSYLKAKSPNGKL